MKQIPTVVVPASLHDRLSQGHPWVYRTHIAKDPGLPDGSWVQIRCNKFAAFGLWDQTSPIAIRIFSHRTLPDAAWVADRVEQAWQARSPVRAACTSGYRWISGEGDGIPGIVVDIYGEYALIKTYVHSVEQMVAWVADALHAHTRLNGILWSGKGREVRPLWGRPPPSDLVIEENGLLFYADLYAGQKTGLFFDQRENRLTVSKLTKDKTLLDCFSYTGGFSLYALRGGARSITACDIAENALNDAQLNLTLNGFSPSENTFIAGDCFHTLDALRKDQMLYDIVIVDPPSFARNRKKQDSARRAYERLNELAIHCVQKDGFLVSASCTSQISPEDFRRILARAARRAGKRLQIVHEAGQAMDHPVPAHFPEARYLKFVISRVTPIA